jgi:hypothetical protein
MFLMTPTRIVRVAPPTAPPAILPTQLSTACPTNVPTSWPTMPPPMAPAMAFPSAPSEYCLAAAPAALPPTAPEMT